MSERMYRRSLAFSFLIQLTKEGGGSMLREVFRL